MTVRWICTGCDKQRRYVEKISVQNGGTVSRCGECRYKAERTGAKVAPTLCRFLTESRLVAGEFPDTASYTMCDSCIDAEIARFPDADIDDGRKAAVA